MRHRGISEIMCMKVRGFINPIVKLAFVSAISTAFIAIFSFASLWLAFTIRASDKMYYHQQVKDLFDAIIISNIISDPQATKGSTHLKLKKDEFKECYRDKPPIFD